MNIIIIGFGSFLASILSVWIISFCAYRYGWVAYPRKDRWHQKPVALFGGVGIFIAFFLGLFFLFIIAPSISDNDSTILFLFGSVIAFAVGLLDDKFNIKPSTKLIGQIIAAAIPIVGGAVVGLTSWHLVNILITFFWFLAIMNAFNLFDNMDGLAAGMALIAAATIICLRLISFGFSQNDFILGIAVIFAYAVAGFWLFNHPPASIFMGDAGSLFLGFMLAGLTMPVDVKGNPLGATPLLSLLLPLAALIVPLFDMALVTIGRIWHGLSPAQGGKDHSSHRLVGFGFSEDYVVMILCGLAAVGGIIAIAMRLFPFYILPLLILYAVFLVIVGVYLGRAKVYAKPNEDQNIPRWTPLATQFLYKRRVAEVMLDFILISLSYYIAYFLRFEGVLQEQADYYIQSFPIVIIACLFGFYISGVYRGIWQFITTADVGRYLRGVITGVGISVFFIAIIYHFEGYSRAVFVIFGILLFLAIVGSRLSMRVLAEFIRKHASQNQTINILIYGAGKAGKLLYEECMQNPRFEKCRVVGFFDDDEEKRGLSIAGLTIYGRDDIALEHLNLCSVNELWISSSRVAHDRIALLIHDIEKVSHQSVKARKFTITIDELENPLISQ